jgi:hypothetical protein
MVVGIGQLQKLITRMKVDQSFASSRVDGREYVALAFK